MNLKIKVLKEIEVPDGVKVINNSDWVTLAYIEDEDTEIISVYTNTAEKFFNEPVLYKGDFKDYNRKEVEKMLEMLNK